MRAADSDDMLSRIKDCPTGPMPWAIATRASIPPAYSDVRSIVVAAWVAPRSGGDLAAALLADELKGPMNVHRDYGLPAYVGRDSLVIVSSYSGKRGDTVELRGGAKARGEGLRSRPVGRSRSSRASSNYPVVTFSLNAQRVPLGTRSDW